jgi:hypothetical protein
VILPPNPQTELEIEFFEPARNCERGRHIDEYLTGRFSLASVIRCRYYASDVPSDAALSEGHPVSLAVALNGTREPLDETRGSYNKREV